MEISDYWSYRDTAVAFSKLREAELLIGGDNFLKQEFIMIKTLVKAKNST